MPCLFIIRKIISLLLVKPELFPNIGCFNKIPLAPLFPTHGPGGT